MGPVYHILITGQEAAASFYLFNIYLYPLHTSGGDFKHRDNLNTSLSVDDQQGVRLLMQAFASNYDDWTIRGRCSLRLTIFALTTLEVFPFGFWFWFRLGFSFPAT